jgi:hypothetical protein
MVTDSSLSPSADCPTSFPAGSKTNRSRSAAGSDGLPIVARSDVVPGVTATVYCFCAVWAMLSVLRRALPRVVRPSGR